MRAEVTIAALDLLERWGALDDDRMEIARGHILRGELFEAEASLRVPGGSVACGLALLVLREGHPGLIAPALALRAQEGAAVCREALPPPQVRWRRWRASGSGSGDGYGYGYGDGYGYGYGSGSGSGDGYGSKVLP